MFDWLFLDTIFQVVSLCQIDVIPLYVLDLNFMEKNRSVERIYEMYFQLVVYIKYEKRTHKLSLTHTHTNRIDGVGLQQANSHTISHQRRSYAIPIKRINTLYVRLFPH